MTLSRDERSQGWILRGIPQEAFTRCRYISTQPPPEEVYISDTELATIPGLRHALSWGHAITYIVVFEWWTTLRPDWFYPP